jgi:hypothetical protein
MESCFTNAETYDGCGTSADITGSGIPLGSGDGQAEVTADSLTGYTVVGHSRSGNDFTYEKAGSTVTRSCTTASTGGCGNSTSSTSW